MRLNIPPTESTPSGRSNPQDMHIHHRLLLQLASPAPGAVPPGPHRQTRPPRRASNRTRQPGQPVARTPPSPAPTPRSSGSNNPGALTRGLPTSRPPPSPSPCTAQHDTVEHHAPPGRRAPAPSNVAPAGRRPARKPPDGGTIHHLRPPRRQLQDVAILQQHRRGLQPARQVSMGRHDAATPHAPAPSISAAPTGTSVRNSSRAGCPDTCVRSARHP